MASSPWRRWDLVLLDLEAVRGSEQGRTRPALVVSNDDFNARFPLVTVLPLTKQDGKKRRAYDFEVLLREGAGNRRHSIVMPHQIRTVSVARVLRRLGRLDDADLRQQVEDRLLEHLAIRFEEA